MMDYLHYEVSQSKCVSASFYKALMLAEIVS